MGLTGAALPSLIADNGNKDFLLNTTNSAFLQSFFPGSYVFGNAIGPILSPITVFFIGFKFTLMLYSLVALLSQTISVFSAHYAMLIVGRVITGIASGVISTAGIEYANSLAPPKIKGVVGTMYLIGLTTFVLVANTTTFFALIVHDWRWMTAVGVFPPLMLFFVSIIMPESPIWRKERKKRKEKKPEEKEKNFQFIIVMKKIVQLKTLWRLFLCFLLIISLHLGGLVPMMIFLPITIQKAGVTNFYYTALASIGVSFWNIVTAIIPTLFVDCFGRKLLLTVGYIIMFFSTLSLGFIVYFVQQEISGILSIIMILIFLVGNNGGINSLIFILFSELFDGDISIITSAWNLTIFNFVSFLIGFMYLSIEIVVGLPGVLWIFSGITLVCGTFLTIFLPETKKLKKSNKEMTEQNEKEKENLETEMKEEKEIIEQSVDVCIPSKIDELKKHEESTSTKIDEMNLENTEIFIK
eukprot:gene12269-5853_t